LWQSRDQDDPRCSATRRRVGHYGVPRVDAAGLAAADDPERVLKAAHKLAYHPNRAARSLITGKTGNIGIVVPDLSNPFYPAVVRGIQLRAHQAGYSVFLADSNENGAAE
jgi:ABC-type sugar transport system substrate-binding protein